MAICPMCGEDFVVGPCGFEHCKNPDCPCSYEKGQEHCRRDHVR